ncbi:MAG: hypothetical protein D3917_18735 [Candidatus Electrothrix sp. AX5]|nr:hypothetical protein [Candidatus Electrothrix sp. AX5]
MLCKLRWSLQPVLLVFFFIALSLTVATPAHTATAGLYFAVPPAPAGGTAAVFIAVTSPDDIESFSLELNFATGNILTLAAASWEERWAYYPESAFGPAPQAELNDIRPNGNKTKIFINGFAPNGTSGSIGRIHFDVASGAADSDTQVLSLTGKYRSKSTGEVKEFLSATTTFTVGEDAPLDTDQDGIDDDWEEQYFGDLVSANTLSDWDQDGYTDLQEYLNQLIGETDSEGWPYDPKSINTPGGTGYHKPGNGNVWLLFLPAILGR